MKFVVSSGQDRTTLDQGVPFQIRFPVAEGLWISWISTSWISAECFNDCVFAMERV